MQTLPKVGDAALYSIHLGADLGETGLLTRTDLQEFAPVVEGQLVVVFARTVDNDAVRLWKGVH